MPDDGAPYLQSKTLTKAPSLRLRVYAHSSGAAIVHVGSAVRVFVPVCSRQRRYLSRLDEVSLVAGASVVLGGSSRFP